MKLSDFEGEDFESHGKIKLSEWVINGEHYPEVEIYHKNDTNEGFQVSAKHKKFRKTKPTEDKHQVQEYGKWEDLDE